VPAGFQTSKNNNIFASTVGTMKTRLITAFLLLIAGLPVLAQGYRIGVEIGGLAGDTLLLGYHFGDRKFIADTVILDEKGKGTFTGSRPLAGGIYLVVLPDKSYFEIMITEDQDFSVRTRLDNLAGELQFSGSPVNDAFLEYQQKMISFRQRSESLRKNINDPPTEWDARNIEEARSRLADLDREVEAYYDEVIVNHQGSLLAHIVQAMKPPHIPDFDIPADSKNPDSLRMVMQYGYMRDHFFDGFAWSDSSMLRTPILHNKLRYYITRVLIQHPDSLVQPVMNLIGRSKAHPSVFQYVSVYLLNNFMQSKIMGHDKVYVRIAQRVYLSGEAFWAEEEFLSELRENVARVAPTLIGETGHDLIMEGSTGEWHSLHQVEADYTVLYFWEPDCGHCKVTTPQLREMYKEWKNRNIEVFAVYTHDNRDEWLDYIAENRLEWINVYDPMHQTNFRYWYHIISTPTIYLLDRDKKILAKRISVETLGDMINRLLDGRGI